MKIAIVAPSPVPFGVGGAEKLWWGLQEYINKQTSHNCELIKLPAKENGFWELLDSYYAFYRLDLSHFDMVISGKYPAWAIRHKNHHIYMLHTLRGLYDTYPFKDGKIKTEDERVKKILDFMDQKRDDTDSFFKLIFALKGKDDIDPSLFAFPAPFIRKIVHYLDALFMKDVKSFSAISKTVANRREYFPKDAKVLVNYPPSNLERFESGSYEYFFTVSRLDNAKRIKDIILSYKNTDISIPLKIAGSGPLQNELKEIAKDDKRIEFLGFVSDEELIKLYKNAYAVIFVPFEEDYGLITIEAMMSKKSVITYSDSGGVLEFVKDQKTGLVAKANDIKDLSSKLSFLAFDVKLAKEFGENGYEIVKNITWKNCADKLLKVKKRKKITVLSTYPIFPPRGGGQNRIYYLYKEVAKDFDVEIISISNNKEDDFYKEIAPNLYERRIPKSDALVNFEMKMQKAAGVPVSDVVVTEYFDKLPLLKEEFLKSSKESFVSVTNHPYFYPFLKKYSSKPILHESHNFEYLLKKDMFDKNKESQKILKKLFETEKEATQKSIATIFCSKEDEVLMSEAFLSPPKKALLIPNGVDLNSVFFTDPKMKEKKKRELGFEGNRIALFIGSWHKPNIDAVYRIFEMAKKVPDVKFVILGSVGLFFGGKEKPENVGFTGIVDDDEKASFLSVSDVALNPMLSGSGTNLKMLDYMAAGICVLSTKVGARGLDIPEGIIKIAKVDDFYKYIKDIQNYTDVYRARKFVEKNYSWKVIGDKLRKFYSEISKKL